MERESNRATPSGEEGPWSPTGAEASPPTSLVSDGRARRAVVEIFDAMQRTATSSGWLRAADLLSARLRDARGLHSSERRLVADSLHRLVRGLRRLRALCGVTRPTSLQLLLATLADQALDAGTALPAALLRELQAAGISPEVLMRRHADLSPPLSPERLGESLSYPEWLVSAVVADLGAGPAEAVLRAQNGRAPLTVRVNLLRGSRDALQARLREEGVESTPTTLSPHGLILHTRVNAYGLQAFRDGLMELQDEGSQLIAEVTAPPPGGVVVDACAGAGGKTLALAALLGNRGRIVAIDVDGHKLTELQRRARRAGLSNVATICAPVQEVSPDRLPRGADRVLVDAPCSGLGVLRRNPEARWRLSPADVAEIGARQRQILSSAAALVAPHGRLIYATCTILRRENDGVVAEFLERHPDFSEVPVKEILGGARAAAIGDGQRLRLLPLREDGPDGFFAAVLRRAG